MNRYISLWRIVSIVANISLGSFYFGYTIIYLSVIDFDTIIIIFDIQISRNAALGMLTFCVPVGGLIGSFFSSYFIQHFSRRYNDINVVNLSSISTILLLPWASLFSFKILSFICSLDFFKEYVQVYTVLWFHFSSNSSSLRSYQDLLELFISYSSQLVYFLVVFSPIAFQLYRVTLQDIHFGGLSLDSH